MSNQSISLAMYGIRIKLENDKKGTYRVLDEIPDCNINSKTNDLLDILYNIFEDLREENKCLKSDNPLNEGKSIYISKLFPLKNDFDERGFYGIVDYGRHGNVRIVQNINENIDEENQSRISINDGVFDPYYFLFVLPKDLTEGYLILEKKAGVGIKTMFESVFLKSFNNYPKYHKYKIDLSRVFPKELAEKFYENGKLISLKLIKSEITSDIANDLNTEIKNVVTEIKIENEISPQELFKNNNNILSFKGLDYDEARVTSKYGGKQKTFILNDPTTIIPYIDVTDEINLGDDGNPKLKSIHNVAIDHMYENFGHIFNKFR